jgi:hypothetical protein
MAARHVFAMLLFLCMCSINLLIFDKYNKQDSIIIIMKISHMV